MQLRPLLLAMFFTLAISVASADAEHLVWSGLVIAENVPQPAPIPPELTTLEQTLKDLFGYNQFEVIGQSNKTLKTGEEDWLANSKYFGLHVDARGENDAGYTFALIRLRAEMRIRVGLVISFALPLTMNGEKPYTFANTPGKLPKQVVPLEYSIRIVPDVSKFTFSGSETVKLKASAPVHELVLNSLDLEIAKASIDGTQLSPAAIKLDPNNELLTIALPNELAIGEHSLALEFSGTITPKGRGFYYMPYQEQGTGAKKIALGTQFEP